MPGSDSFTRRALPRGHTRFGVWISDVGIDTIVDALKSDPEVRCTISAVRKWLLGHEPRPMRARALVELSKQLGKPISLEMIYDHGRELEILSRDQSKTEIG